MIIIKLMGGASNQMFQYAFGQFLVSQNFEVKYDLYSDPRMLNNDLYMLDKLCTKLAFADKNEIDRLKKLPHNIFQKFAFKFARKFNPDFPLSWVKEDKLSLKNKLLIKNDIYLDGYWQNEKFFKTIHKILLDHFKPKQKVPKNYQNVKKLIETGKSVSIHVRRKDYVENPKLANKYFNLATTDYYQISFNFLESRLKTPVYFIFSDDIKYCKGSMLFSGVDHTRIHYIENDNSIDILDQWLMSLCSHNIIANSTFSWWGAWLNDNKNKVVIAPNKWFTDEKRLNPACDSWIKI